MHTPQLRICSRPPKISKFRNLSPLSEINLSQKHPIILQSAKQTPDVAKHSYPYQPLQFSKPSY